QERKYLVFDLMEINGVSLIECPFGERRKMLEEQVIRPRRNLVSSPCYNLEPFGVEVNKFWLLSDINDLVNKFTPELSHGADGIIFQRWNDRYVPFANQGLLKWKPPEKNSVDFLFELDGTVENPSLYLYEGGRKKYMHGNRVMLRNGEDASEFLSLGSIIECSYYKENVWCFMRVRKDRDTPNAFRTYKSVMRSIKDNITEEVLLDEMREIVHPTTTAIRSSMGGGGHGAWRPTTCKTSGTSGHSTAKCYRSHTNKGVGGVRKEWVPKVNKIVQAAGVVQSQENANVFASLDDKEKGKEGIEANSSSVRICVEGDGMLEFNALSCATDHTYSRRFKRAGSKETSPKKVLILESFFCSEFGPRDFNS
ncbi:hypothetical protein MKX03_001117, partial [Papaver bracteatum]